MLNLEEEWLNNEDMVCRDMRLSRLKWIYKEYPDINIALFHGGIKSYFLFEEARYCFVYGQNIASIILSVSFIENTLASRFYASGRDDLKRAGIHALVLEAHKDGFISDSDFEMINKVKNIRNPLAHFRLPLDRESFNYRAEENEILPEDILEDDAKIALKASFIMLENTQYIQNSIMTEHIPNYIDYLQNNLN